MATMSANFKSSERPVLSRWPPQPTTPLVPDCILPNLYLTDLFTARSILLPNYPGPGRPNIKYMLSVLDNSLAQPKPQALNANNFVQKLIILDDTVDEDLLVKLGEACDWIDECISSNDGGVLVHCLIGQSRSASVVIAYIMRKEKLDFEAALAKVKRKRGIVKPNEGFQKQLRLWAEMEYGILEVDTNAGEQNDAENGRQHINKEVYLKWKEEQRKPVQRILG